MEAEPWVIQVWLFVVWYQNICARVRWLKGRVPENRSKYKGEIKNKEFLKLKTTVKIIK